MITYGECKKPDTLIGELILKADKTDLEAIFFTARADSKCISQSIKLCARVAKSTPEVKLQAFIWTDALKKEVEAEGFFFGSKILGIDERFFKSGVYAPKGAIGKGFVLGEYLEKGCLTKWSEIEIKAAKKKPLAPVLKSFTSKMYSDVYDLCERAGAFSKTLAIENRVGDRNHLYLWALMNLGLPFGQAFEYAFLNALTVEDEERESLLSDIKMNDRYSSLKDMRIGEFEIGWGAYDPERKLNEKEKASVPVLDIYVPTEQDDLLVSLFYKSKETGFPIISLMLQGDAGSGKTTLQRRIARDLQLPYAEFTCAAETDKYDVDKILIPTVDKDGNLKHKYQPSSIIEAFYKGWVVGINEINMVKRPGVLTVLNPIFEPNGIYTVQGHVYRRHKDFLVIASCNQDDYEGAVTMNQAVKNRFMVTAMMNKLSKESMKARIEAQVGLKFSA